MKCIVTGGCGFIGSTLVDELVALGHEVVVIDNESSDANEQFYYNGAAEYHTVDIFNYGAIRSLFENADYVFHLAAEARIQPCIQNPELAVETNIVGTFNVLKASHECGVKRVLFSSTSAAYGLANKSPQREDMQRDCLNPYSVTKCAGEDLCKMYTTLYGLGTVIFRYFNVYGDRQPVKGQYAPVIGLFQRQFASGKPMTVVGDGEQTRDYVNARDIVAANIIMMQSDDDTIHGEIFNVGTGVSYSVNDLVEMIGGENASCVNLPPRPGEARHTKADNSKLRAHGWKPEVSLDEWLNARRVFAMGRGCCE